MLQLAKEIIRDSLINNNLEIIEVFECGTSKIEIMVKYNDKIISISFVDDLSYDFMIFDCHGDKILYSNTEKLLSLNELRVLINQDIYKTLTEY